jgi:hypothetical protein
MQNEVRYPRLSVNFSLILSFAFSFHVDPSEDSVLFTYISNFLVFLYSLKLLMIVGMCWGGIGTGD